MQMQNKLAKQHSFPMNEKKRAHWLASSIEKL